MTPPRFADRWWTKLLLVLAGTLLLSLSFAPFHQFYVAWFALAPLLLVLRSCRRIWSALFWGWLAGSLFFLLNLWWLVFVTGPGSAALTAWLGLYWAGAAAVVWPILRRLHATTPEESPRAAMALLLVTPVAWVAFEWLRGYWPFNGLPWFYFAHSQARTVALVMCQIADLTGELGVSAWLFLVNALATLLTLNGFRFKGLSRPMIVTGSVLVVVAAYGVFRTAQGTGGEQGPSILLVQPNFPQDNSGNKGATIEEIVDFHSDRTHAGLKHAPETDLVVWSETMMPPLNREALDYERFRKIYLDRIDAAIERYQRAYVGTVNGSNWLVGRLLRAHLYPPPPPIAFVPWSNNANRLVREFAVRSGVGMLVGGRYAPNQERYSAGKKTDLERNSAYFYQRGTGEQLGRFDKIHLVPFGEYIPFREGWPWLYRRLIVLGPPDMEDYQLDPGDTAQVFSLSKDRLRPSPEPARNWRFVTPICFEDIDGDLCAWLMRGGAARGSLPNGRKDADFIVNITNDGWFGGGPDGHWIPPFFRGQQMAQHLQIASLRAIENRTPMVRCVNTGISALIDSTGRLREGTALSDDKPVQSLRAGIDGVLSVQVELDHRTTLYTQWGNLIGPGSMIGVVMILGARMARRIRRSR